MSKLLLKFKSLHWLKINGRFGYKLLRLNIQSFTSTEPSCLHSVVVVVNCFFCFANMKLFCKL